MAGAVDRARAIRDARRVCRRAMLTVLMLATLACDRPRSEEAPPPPPTATPHDFACRAAVNLRAEACPGMPKLDASKCELTREPQTTKRDAKTIEGLGTGEFVNFGLPGPEWFLRNRSLLLANNDDAVCGNLTTVGRYASPKREARGACSGDEIMKAQVIESELVEAGFGVDDPEVAQRNKAAAMKRAAKELDISVKEAAALYEHAVIDCLEQMTGTSPTCSDRDVDIAEALQDAEIQITLHQSGKSGMALLKERQNAARRVGKRFGIGPAAVTMITDKVNEHCPHAVPPPSF